MKNNKVLVVVIASVAGICTLVCLIVFAIILISNQNGSSASDSKTFNNKAGNNSSGGSDFSYDCLYSADDQIAPISSYKFELAVSEATEVAWGEKWLDTGVRKINLTALKNYTPKERIYYSYYKTDGSVIENLDLSFQVCDGNNKTNISSYLDSKSTNNISNNPGEGQSYSAYTELPGFSAPDNSGNYRIDALVYYQGQWRLVARYEQIEFYK